MLRDKTLNIIKKYYYIFLLILPFAAMDAGIRLLGRNIHYFRASMILPNIMFVIIWIGLIVGITVCLRRFVARIVYGVFFLLFYVFFLTNSIYYSLTGYFFGFHLFASADEGSKYIADTILGAGPVIYMMGAVILGLFVLAEVKIPQNAKSSFKGIACVIGAFVALHSITPFFLGKANAELKWDTWRNPRNVYENFNDSNKNMKICGLFEYSIRDFYITFLKPDEPEDAEELEALSEAYSKETLHDVNEMTGIFQGKNVIFLQLEGMDDWLLNEEDTPNLYGLMQESLVFENHYSYYNGGGSTFNSELAVNTGFITPISYTRNAYSFSSNLFEYSMPKIFKKAGYSVNAFHMNTEEYYSRGINYKNWGYDNYYGLIDRKEYKDLSYELDRELIQNEEFYDRIFRQEGPFVHYIITYTPHTPFTTSKGMGKYLAKLNYDNNIPDLNEEESARLYAAETDYMVQLLMQGLKENGLYENTVIIAFADHYLYTLNDKTILDKYKNTENNLVNHTPFFVWSSDLKELISEDGRHVEKVNSQLDILPTVLNLFGFEYLEEHYIGNDIFDEKYSGYAFFSDYSWYNGTVYVENPDSYDFIGDTTMSKEEIASLNQIIVQLIKKNDLTLKYDYFRRASK